MEYVYTVWFRDATLAPEDQDYEWPACILINAQNKTDAQKWGDHLAERYCAKDKNQIFLLSEICTKNDPLYKNELSWQDIPLINYGEEASDNKISW